MKYFRCKTQHLRQDFLFGFLAVGLFLVLPALTLAAPGDLDLTFGSGGIVISRGSNLNDLGVALAMAIQSDGKIVVVGDGATSNTWDFAVVRYNTDGSLDSSFGGTGIVITEVGNSHDQATSVAIQADGKIIVAGGSFNNGAGSSFAVVRYNPNGSLDPSFNGTGKVITSFGSSHSSANRLAIQADGKIVAAGYIFNAPNDDSVVVRYNSNGSLDTSFNGTGKIITQFACAASIVIQTDGKVVVAGRSYNGSRNDITIFRYNTDGSPDNSFNGTGKVTTSVGNSDSGAADLAIQTDGKIVAVGSANSTVDFAVVRLNPNGSLDGSFGGTGIVITPVGNSQGQATSVVIQPDGKIVAAGDSYHDIGSDFAVVRLNPNGSLDTTFNGTGKVITPIGPAFDRTRAAAIQADGKIVVAGNTDGGFYDFYDFVVVRYQGDVASAACSNRLDCADFFVRQHYLDFLNREPDPGGLAYWTDRITECGSDARCIHERRIAVSAAFFGEMEFQETGYYVDRFYKASFGRQPTNAEFTADRGKVIGGANLEASKQAFADEWVQRPSFVAAYPLTLSNTEVVNKLFDSAGLTSSRYDSQRLQEILAMNSGRSRALVLRDVIEISDFKNIPDTDDPRYTELKQVSQYNQAFVLMQYFGYLGRNVDPTGYAFWLDVVNNREPNNYRAMVCAFITSQEYQLRFGSDVTRSNGDCGQ